MSFDDEMNEIANAESQSKYISKPCVELCTLSKYEMSPSGHKGKPYIDFTFVSVETGESNRTRFYRTTPEDTDAGKEFKLKRLKELFENAGGDFSKKGEDVIKSAIGNQLNVLFKQSEYLGYDKDQNNKPVIKTKIEYSFSSEKDKPINGNESYLYGKLREADAKKYQGELAKWERDNKNTQPTSQSIDNEVSEDDDGLPF